MPPIESAIMPASDREGKSEKDKPRENKIASVRACKLELSSTRKLKFEPACMAALHTEEVRLNALLHPYTGIAADAQPAGQITEAVALESDRRSRKSALSELCRLSAQAIVGMPAQFDQRTERQK
jgi:hypothetical protein